jgi:DNA-binding beta-propeller fold protein YncE
MSTPTAATRMSGAARRLAGIICLAALASLPGRGTAMRQGDAPLAAGPPIAVPGTTGRFDFIEAVEGMDRLLASHTGNGTLDVFSLETGALEQKVAVGAAQSVAVDAAGGKYYVACSQPPQLAIVDRKTLTKTGAVPLGGPADLVALDTKRGRVYVGHDDASELWVVDPKSQKIVATVAFPPGEGPEGVVYDAGADRIYQSIKTADAIVMIDPASNTVKARWPTTPAARPHGLALDAARHRLFSAGANGKLAVLDARTGKVVASVEIANNVDQVGFDPEKRRVYCGSSTGVVSVVEETDDGARLVANVKTAPGAKSIAVDPKRHAVWTCYGSPQASYLIRLAAP